MAECCIIIALSLGLFLQANSGITKSPEKQIRSIKRIHPFEPNIYFSPRDKKISLRNEVQKRDQEITSLNTDHQVWPVQLQRLNRRKFVISSVKKNDPDVFGVTIPTVSDLQGEGPRTDIHLNQAALGSLVTIVSSSFTSNLKSDQEHFTDKGEIDSRQSSLNIVRDSSKNLSSSDKQTPVEKPDLSYTSFVANKRCWKDRKCFCLETRCNYACCNLTVIPSRLPQDVTELYLDFNNIKSLAKDSFFSFSALKRLSLASNRMISIEQGCFKGLVSLLFLDLSWNSLGAVPLPEHVFAPLRALKVLHLQYNHFPCNQSSTYLDVLLSDLLNVEELSLDNYDSDSQAVKFNSMNSLRKLKLDCNQCPLHRLSRNKFVLMEKITQLDISNCGIQGRGLDNDTMSPLLSLKVLDISYNPEIGVDNLPALLWGLRESNLTDLNVSNIVSPYSVTTVTAKLTHSLPRALTSITAKRNNIVYVHEDAIERLPKTLKLIDTNENFLFTNPTQLPLYSLESLERLQMNTFSDECNFYKNDILNKAYFQSTLANIATPFATKPVNNTSVQNTIIPPKLKYLQLGVRLMHSEFLLSIDNSNILRELDLSCSYFPEFDFPSLIHLTRLAWLSVSSSFVRTLQPPAVDFPTLKVLILRDNRLNDYLGDSVSPFIHLPNVEYLDLSLNEIIILPKDIFGGLHQLRYVYLQRNILTTFNVDLSKLSNLILMDISHTKISTLTSSVRHSIDQLCPGQSCQLNLSLAGCDIQCDCLNLDFLQWMAASPVFHGNFSGYKCKYADTSVKFLEDGYQSTIAALVMECADNYRVFLLVVGSTCLLVCAVFGVVVYRFRWRLRYLYYAAYLKYKQQKMAAEHTFEYDVFISYDSEDQNFITTHLGPELERRGLRPLIHLRDFVAGTFIASNILMAVTSSRKTLVVLTRNLLASTWCNYELQMANMESVQTGREVLVFLLKENIPCSELSLELLNHIRSNTYIAYPQPQDVKNEGIMSTFYDKLTQDLRS